jgi:uncharacterized protein (DUF362 family)
MTQKSTVSIVKSDLPVVSSDIQKMTAQAVDLIGGINQYVKPGQSVVIKPNLFAPYPPPVSVDRRVIAAVVSLCKSAGAAEVTVVEGVSVGSLMKRVNIEKSDKSGDVVRGMKTVDVMQLLGVKRAVEEAGGRVQGVEDGPRVKTAVIGGKVLTTLDYPKSVLDADVFINLPALKTHTMTMVTLGIKNLQGLLNEADRYFGHRDDLDQHMVDIMKVRKPDLTIIDGLIGMEGMGAGEGGGPVPLGVIIAGADPVATDAIASMVMGIESPTVVGTTRIAAHDGLGTALPDLIDVVGSTVADVKKKFILPINFTQPVDTFVTGVWPNVDVFIGGACPTCWLMAALALPSLNKLPERAALVVGVDPKVSTDRPWDEKNTFFLGDCALGCSGDAREIRNRIALSGNDTFLPGCPPYEQALKKLEDIMVDRGIITRGSLIHKAREHRDRFFEYYRGFDPTWKPEL